MGATYTIIGKGGLFNIIREILVAQDFLGYYDDKESNDPERLGKLDQIGKGSGNIFIAIAAISNMLLREKLIQQLVAGGRMKSNAISPLAYISPSARTGFGNILSPFACIHSGATFGNGCVFFSNSVVEHDCVIGDNLNTGPGVSIAGSVKIGNNVFIGAGSVLRDGITIGSNTIIGAGSVVLQDLPSNIIAYGNPARQIRANDMYKVV